MYKEIIKYKSLNYIENIKKIILDSLTVNKRNILVEFLYLNTIYDIKCFPPFLLLLKIF